MVEIGLEELYSDIILDYAKNERYKKEIQDAKKAEGKNLSCGDEITLYLKVKDNIIKEVTFTGHGCIISQASASMMCEYLEGKTVDEAKKFYKKL